MHRVDTGQSAKLFLQSSELELPTPSPAGEGVGRPQVQRGDGHCGTLCISYVQYRYLWAQYTYMAHYTLNRLIMILGSNRP